MKNASYWIDRLDLQPHPEGGYYKETFRSVIKPDCWFAAEVPSKLGFALVSCAVAPGFDFSEFEMATKNSLSSAYPFQISLIEKLCRF